MSNFHNIIEETKKEVEILLDDKENRPYYMLDKQLESIIKELDKMDSIRDADVFVPYYPRGIADSWDFQDPLGEKLLNILEIYNKL